MSDNSPSWDNIPSIENLKIDWDFEPENSMGKRAYSRLTINDLRKLFNHRDIPVKMVSEKGPVTAFLFDISQSGICLKTQFSHFADSELVKFGFILGEYKVISRGKVKHVRQENEWNILGVEFVGLSGENQKFIAQLYSSAKFKGGQL